MRLFPSAPLAALALAAIAALSACSGGDASPAPPADEAGPSDPSAASASAAAATPTPISTATPAPTWEPPPGQEPLTGLIAISSGRSATCALRADGSPVCWGGASGEWDSPEGPFIDVSVLSGGDEWTVVCGLREEGGVECWGDEVYGMSPPSPPEGERFSAISGWCGIRQSDGAVACWGLENSYEVALSPEDYGEGSSFTAVSGRGAPCALLEDGEATCAGEVGHERFASVSAGGRLSCGLRKEDGLPVCWDSPHILERHPPPEGESFASVSSSPYLEFVCALRADGSPACWGYDMYIGATLPPTDERFAAISAGDYHVCGIRDSDGAPLCWGAGQPTWDLGQASPPGGDRPQPWLSENETFIAISAGAFHACALRPDGTPVCAGSGDFGGGQPPKNERLIAISIGAGYTCGLRMDGSPICWSSANLGDGDAEPRPSIWGVVDALPRLSWPEGETFTAISAGVVHACALREDGFPVCWLPYEIEDDPLEYELVSPPAGETFTSISSGSWYTCGLRRDGSPLCWASLSGEEVDDSPEFGPPDGERFTAISSGTSHACALREDGTAVCWPMVEFADEDSGQDRAVYDVGQTDPPEGEEFSAISSGSEHTCAIRKNGSLTCWGTNFVQARAFAMQEPPPPPEEDRFIAVSAGFYRVCALREDGSPKCWGI